MISNTYILNYYIFSHRDEEIIMLLIELIKLYKQQFFLKNIPFLIQYIFSILCQFCSKTTRNLCYHTLMLTVLMDICSKELFYVCN